MLFGAQKAFPDSMSSSFTKSQWIQWHSFARSCMNFNSKIAEKSRYSCSLLGTMKIFIADFDSSGPLKCRLAKFKQLFTFFLPALLMFTSFSWSLYKTWLYHVVMGVLLVLGLLGLSIYTSMIYFEYIFTCFLHQINWKKKGFKIFFGLSGNLQFHMML